MDTGNFVNKELYITLGNMEFVFKCLRGHTRVMGWVTIAGTLDEEYAPAAPRMCRSPRKSSEVASAQ